MRIRDARRPSEAGVGNTVIGGGEDRSAVIHGCGIPPKPDVIWDRRSHIFNGDST
jgi:hypothetical protein